MARAKKKIKTPRYEHVTMDTNGVHSLDGVTASFLPTKKFSQEVNLSSNMRMFCQNCMYYFMVINGRVANSTYRFQCPSCKKLGIYNPKSDINYQVSEKKIDGKMQCVLTGSKGEGEKKVDIVFDSSTPHAWIDTRAPFGMMRQAGKQQAAEEDFIDIWSSP
jgi:hypothetical protein